MNKLNLTSLLRNLLSIPLIAGAIFCFPAIGNAAKWQTPKLPLCGRLLTAMDGNSEQKALLQAAGFSTEKYVGERPLVHNIAAAFGLQFGHGYDGKKYSHVYRLDPSYGVANFGSPDYYPLSAGYFVPVSTIKLIETIVTAELIPLEFLPAKEPIDLFLDSLDRDNNREVITARLKELKERQTVSIAGTSYVWIGPQEYGKEIPVRLATTVDLTSAPATRTNGLTLQEVLDGVRGGYSGKSQFSDILSSPLRYGGNQSIVYSRELPIVEGSDTYIIVGDRAVRGVYRGYWEPGSIRGWRLNETLRSSRSLHQDGRYHFLEISGPQGKEVIAIESNPELRIFSTARPSR